MENTIQNNSADIISQDAEKSKGEISSENITEKAIEKLNAEYKDFKGGNKEKAVLPYVRNRLEDFCRQDIRFAQTLFRFKRTLSDCLREIMKDVGNSISDIDVYRRAIQFYFPNSEVDFNVVIKITGDGPSEEEINKLPPAPKAKPKQQKTATSKEAKPKKTDKAAPAKKQPEKPEYIQLSLF